MSQQIKTLKDYFPFPQLRPSQITVLKLIENALKEGKKFIILEASTGFGKSPVAITVAKYHGESIICTGTKDLQAQYAKDFPFLKVAKGRNNFPCTEASDKVKDSFGFSIDDVTAEDGLCVVESNYKCPYKTAFKHYDIETSSREHPEQECVYINDEGESFLGGREPCAYYNQKWITLKSSHSLYNYKYFLSLAKSAVRNKESASVLRKKKLLVLDECHDLENELKDFNSVALSTYFIHTILPDYKINMPNRDDILYNTRSWVEELKRLQNELLKFRESNSAETDIKTIKKLSAVDKYVDKLNTLIFELEDLESQNWVISRIERKNNNPLGEIQKVTFLPLSVDRYGREIFEFGDTVLMMSATILSKDSFCRMLGLAESEVAYITVGSEFPVSNRPIYSVGVGNISAKTLDTLLPTIARKCDDIMSRYPNVKGIIHTTSYKQLKYIKENLSAENRKRLIETGEDINREEVVQRHMNATYPSVLISPSFHQGLDLKDDSSRFQIIVKVPYPDLTDRWIKAKMEKDYRWYVWRTVLTLVQSYGRSIRSKDDYADTFILDSNIKLIMNQAKGMLPKWFTEAFIGGVR